MKRPVLTLVINLIVAVILCGVLVAATTVDMLNGALVALNGFSFGIGDNSFLTGDSDYEKGSEGSLPASEITSFDIAWSEGSVELRLTDGDRVRFYESCEDELEDHQIMRWTAENGKLTIRFGFKKGLFRTDPEKKLVIELPASVEQVKKVDIRTASASVELTGWSADTLTVDTVSGAIEVESAKCDSIELNSVSGAFRLEQSECGQVLIDGVSGEVKIASLTSNTVRLNSISGNAVITETDVSGKLDAASTSGNLTFRGSAERILWDSTSGDAKLTPTVSPSQIEIDTTSGDATVWLPADVEGFKAEFDSISGDVSCDFDSEKRGDYYCYGDESLEIEMDSTSGDLRISKAS